MGQGGSQPERRQDNSRPVRRASVFRRSVHGLPNDYEGQQDRLLTGPGGDARMPRPRTRPGSAHRLSQLLNTDPELSAPPESDHNDMSRGAAMLQRTRSTFGNMLRRRDTSNTRGRDAARPQHALLEHRSSYVRTGMNSMGADYYPPRLPSIDQVSNFDNDSLTSPLEPAPLLPQSSHSTRRPNIRLNSLRPDRTLRHLASLRRRRSSPPSTRRMGGADDQAAMLSRLLSVAAAATAATLMGDDHHALSEARSLAGGTGMGEIGTGGEDGSFVGFLQALQNGRIASALRGGAPDSDDASAQVPLNFFRMFRFDVSGPNNHNVRAHPEPQGSEEEDADADTRMIPIIIVGIRSISPALGPGGGSNTDDLPPFIDALGSFPSPLPTHALGADAHDPFLRPPQNGTSFRRRASMGGLGMGRNRLSDRMDDQRDHRSPNRRRERPWSVASSSSNLDPRPPPATPASPSPELSRISSRNTTPSHSRPVSSFGNSMRDFGSDSRRNSALHRATAASPLSSHTEETSSLHSTHSSTNLLNSPHSDAEALRLNTHRRSETAPNIHYPRFASGHPRRNGIVEPDSLPPLSRTSTSNATDSSGLDRRNSSSDSRSWIIYVLGGSYPEDHPILTTPSLFTENPTYEDMMLLSTLLGPAKPPVASEEDVELAGGIYTIELAGPTVSVDATKTAQLVAAANRYPEERLPLDLGQRCLVCLCDFEVKEVARKLIKCGHLFHKECIDQWLTQGRNSCPLCRGQGVNETAKPAEVNATSEDTVAGASDPETSASRNPSDALLPF